MVFPFFFVEYKFNGKKIYSNGNAGTYIYIQKEVENKPLQMIENCNKK